MKKIYFLLVFFGALLFCACEKDNSDLLIEDQATAQFEDGALKGTNSNGMTKGGLLPFPMWARMASGAEYVIPATDEYGIIIFYVNDPDLIPPDHNFYPDNWFAFDALFLPDEAFSVDGNSWHLPGNIAPHHYNMKGKGDVLFWIITFEQVLELLEGESITIPELEALDPLVGHADMYNEVLRPYGGGAPVLGGEINAHGTLEDGRRFIYKMHSRLLPGEPLEAKNKFEIFDK